MTLQCQSKITCITRLVLASMLLVAASVSAPAQNTFQPTGNAGAGTTSPDRKLEVLDSGSPQLRLTHTDGSVYTDIQTIWSGQLLISPTGADASFLKPVSVSADSDAFRFFTNADTNLRWSLSTDASGFFHVVQKGDGWASQGARLSISRSGNVGVGTTAPEAKLNVLGDFLLGGLTDTAVSNYNLGVRGSGSLINGGNGRALTIKAGDSDNTAGRVGGNLILNPGSPVSPAVTFGNVLMATAGGNVGIGTPTPGVKLDVNGYIAAGSLNGFIFTDDLNTGLTSPGADKLNLVTGGLTRFHINDLGNVGIGIGTNVGNTRVNVQGADSTSANYALFVQNSSNTNLLSVRNDGNVGIGKSNPTVALDVQGDIKASGAIFAKYQDLAEWVPSAEHLSAGTVVVLDTTKSNQVVSSSTAYDTRVAGVISTQPGITLGESGEGKVLVATTGRVRVKVDASRGAIQIGDLLVTSDVAGVAMKSEAIEFAGRKMHMPGTIIGKALEPLAKGSGEILVLLSLQ